jgi:hypothetical protein
MACRPADGRVLVVLAVGATSIRGSTALAMDGWIVERVRGRCDVDGDRMEANSGDEEHTGPHSNALLF